MTPRAALLLIARRLSQRAPEGSLQFMRPRRAAQASTGSLLRSDTVSCVESYTPSAAVGLDVAFDGTVKSVAAASTNRTGKGDLDLVAVTSW
jgi:hypothetical protein